MKRLEVGCQALIFGLILYPEDNGKVVTLVEYYPEIETWCCSGDIIDVFGEIGTSNYLSKNLMRIDGGDFQDEETPYAVKDKELQDA